MNRDRFPADDTVFDRAAALLPGLVADLQRDNDAASIKARVGTDLFDRLHERDVCLDSAISPNDPLAPLYTWAKLSCGCSWQCDRFAHGHAVNPRWTVACEDHRS